jgi:tetraacyldisaccharide 4'-kinase
MVTEAPPFWWERADWRAAGLAPLAYVYGRVARSRLENGRRHRAAVPVICVGNLTVGGAGKTPTVLAMLDAVRQQGLTPGILSRGYGGSLEDTTVVDPHHHRARDVGDEPMLLAEQALTVVGRDRIKGAARLVAEGADIILMDDGFQSARLDCDYTLLVIDGMRGIGNGRIIPAGPVRAPVVDQLRHASAVLKIGKGEAAATTIRKAARAGKPIYQAHIAIRNAEAFQGARVLAFAGIADPGKFFRSLEEAGAEIVRRRTFGDHHLFSPDEIADLRTAARKDGLTLVTTAKDAARLRGAGEGADGLLAETRILEIDLTFDDPAMSRLIVEKARATFKSKALERATRP